ncbi:hypothetical protein GJ496_003180 [Pomphorhynchus laevis]|nr:hypothetical protein GJ496_003180 [Pomphorhynchus laevis]
MRFTDEKFWISMSKSFCLLVFFNILFITSIEAARSTTSHYIIDVAGHQTCNINNQQFFGPYYDASIQFKNKQFIGKRCSFILQTSDKYPYVTAYIENKLNEDEYLNIDSFNSTIDFFNKSKRLMCVNKNDSIRVTYRNYAKMPNLRLHAVWSANDNCLNSGEFSYLY